jgi:hypothetical protein
VSERHASESAHRAYETFSSAASGSRPKRSAIWHSLGMLVPPDGCLYANLSGRKVPSVSDESQTNVGVLLDVTYKGNFALCTAHILPR